MYTFSLLWFFLFSYINSFILLFFPDITRYSWRDTDGISNYWLQDQIKRTNIGPFFDNIKFLPQLLVADPRLQTSERLPEI